MSFLDLLLDLERNPAARRYSAEEYNLDGFRSWLHELGDPQDGVPWIHIAGTKGKGSTAAMAESILAAAGFRTGLFTSPHLEHYGERFRFSTQPWSLAGFEAALEDLATQVDPMRRASITGDGLYRTVFEVLTALAFRSFAASGVDAGILEVGLGGRLDCTNVVAPTACAITPVEMDHERLLGDTVEKIAAEKAGIIKAGRPVVLSVARSDLQARALDVHRARAAEVGAPVVEPVPVRLVAREGTAQRVAFDWDGAGVTALLPLLGAHQRDNLGVALALCRVFAAETGRTLEAGMVARGVESVRWGGRIEVLGGSPTVVLDGAHCPLSGRLLAETIAGAPDLLPGPRVLMWGMQRDKDHAAFAGSLGPLGFRAVVAHPVGGGRGAAPVDLVRAAARVGLEGEAQPDVDAALDRASEIAGDGGSILVTGSLYHLARVRHLHRTGGG